MTKKKPQHSGRTPMFFTRPKPGETNDQVATRIADAAVAAINADRKRRGLPPLPDDDKKGE